LITASKRLFKINYILKLFLDLFNMKTPDELEEGVKIEPSTIYEKTIRGFHHNREGSSLRPGVVLVNDITSSAAGRQGQSIQVHCDRPIRISNFSCTPYSLISAAYQLNLTLGDLRQFPSGSIFCVTVDPHVNQNGEGGLNTKEKRSIVIYKDGTIIVGPNHPYVRVGEFQGRGPLVAAFEIDKKKLDHLLYSQSEEEQPILRNQPHVFDGLASFGPTVALLLNGFNPEEFSNAYPVSEIAPLKIPIGTITEIENGYGNIVIECPDIYQIGEKIAVLKDGKLLFIAEKRKAFDLDEGKIVSVDASEPQIMDSKKRALYMAIVEGHLAPFIEKLRGFKLEIGHQLEIRTATEKENRQWEAELKLFNLQERLKQHLDTRVQLVKKLLASIF